MYVYLFSNLEYICSVKLKYTWSILYKLMYFFWISEVDFQYWHVYFQSQKYSWGKSSVFMFKVYFYWTSRDLSKDFNWCQFFWKKIEFDMKGENCLQICYSSSLGYGEETWWAFSVQALKFFRFLMSLRQLNSFQWHLKLYSWSNKLYQFITNMFFLANIPTLGLG